MRQPTTYRVISDCSVNVIQFNLTLLLLLSFLFNLFLKAPEKPTKTINEITVFQMDSTNCTFLSTRSLLLLRARECPSKDLLKWSIHISKKYSPKKISTTLIFTVAMTRQYFSENSLTNSQLPLYLISCSMSFCKYLACLDKEAYDLAVFPPKSWSPFPA